MRQGLGRGERKGKGRGEKEGEEGETYRQRANHGNPHRQPIPQSLKPNIPINPPHGAQSRLARFPIRIQLGHHDVRRVGHDRAPYARNITPEERHPRLLQHRIGLLGLIEGFINHLDRGLEGGEFHHRVRDLPGPERIDALIEPCVALFSYDFAPPFAQRGGVGRERGLHADFDGFEGAEEDVGDELGGRGCAEVDDGFGAGGEEFLPVVVFEYFVGAVFAGPLEAVPDEGRCPAEEDTPQAFAAVDGGPGLEVGFVDFGVDLPAAFDEVEGRDGGVGWAAGCVVALVSARFGACSGPLRLRAGGWVAYQ